MSFLNIEQTLFERARSTSVRAPKTQRALDVSRILSGAAVGAVTLCSMVAVLGSGRAMKAEVIRPENSASGSNDQNAASPSAIDRSATIEHTQPARLADLLV